MLAMTFVCWIYGTVASPSRAIYYKYLCTVLMCSANSFPEQGISAFKFPQRTSAFGSVSYYNSPRQYHAPQLQQCGHGTPRTSPQHCDKRRAPQSCSLRAGMAISSIIRTGCAYSVARCATWFWWAAHTACSCHGLRQRKWCRLSICSLAILRAISDMERNLLSRIIPIR